MQEGWRKGDAELTEHASRGGKQGAAGNHHQPSEASTAGQGYYLQHQSLKAALVGHLGK